MMRLDVALVEWPELPGLGGPRLLGRTADPELVARVRDCILAEHRRDLARLEEPVANAPVRAPEPEGSV